jgi:hypothetical protein
MWNVICLSNGVNLFSQLKTSKLVDMCTRDGERRKTQTIYLLLFQFFHFPSDPVPWKFTHFHVPVAGQVQSLGFEAISCFLDESSHSFTTFGTLTGRWFRTGATVAPDGPATKDAGHLMWSRGHWLVISRTSSSRSRPWSRCLFAFHLYRAKQWKKAIPKESVSAQNNLKKNPPN